MRTRALLRGSAAAAFIAVGVISQIASSQQWLLEQYCRGDSHCGSEWAPCDYSDANAICYYCTQGGVTDFCIPRENWACPLPQQQPDVCGGTKNVGTCNALGKCIPSTEGDDPCTRKKCIATGGG